jgi:hypothetical protein
MRAGAVLCPELLHSDAQPALSAGRQPVLAEHWM